MRENDKQIRKILLFLILMTVLAVTFVSVMGYLNYRTAAIELEEELIARGEAQTITRLETAISFGKSFENFYGIQDIFNTFSRQFPGPQPFIIDREGKLLYKGEGDWSDPNRPEAYLASDEFRFALPTIQQDNGGTLRERQLHIVFSPIRQEEKTIGFFGCVFTEEIFNDSFQGLRGKLSLMAPILTVGLILGLFIWVRSLRNYREKQGIQFKPRQMKIQGMTVLAVGILVISIFSIYTYQNDYIDRIQKSVQTTLDFMGSQIERVRNQGIDLREVPDVKNFMQRQVSSQENIKSLRITENIFEVQRTAENSELVTYTFRTKEGQAGDMTLEAEISEAAIQDQMRNILLVLISSMIILLLFLFEFNTLIELLTGGGNTREKSVMRYEKQMGQTLRFTSFLYATAEYMCVPYAAMMIRARGEGLFGLSVGMTAALPITVEGITQILAMLFLPRLIRKWKIRPVLYASAALMIACNVTSFAVNNALTILLCRALAGIAYAGFKQVSNGIIVNGYETEAGRSENIVQENSGIMAGSVCGAGLGAILSGSAGYQFTFLSSAVLFILYLAMTLRLVPWSRLTERSEEKEKKKIGVRSVARLLFSPETLVFILVIGIPLNIGVMLCMTLIPAVVQTQGISSVMLSYCYIANGLAGAYIGPALVSVARKRFGLGPGIALAFAMTAAAVFLLKVPPVMVMIIVSSLILGFLDGFATPMMSDLFLRLKAVRREVDEGSALIINAEINYVLLTFAPIVAEQMLLPGAMPIGALAYVTAAALTLVFGLRYRRKRKPSPAERQ